ncbi:MAG TPA: replication initiation protein [Flavobacterium sp.]
MELRKITDDKVLKQHNLITTARYDFSACQLDVMFMLLAVLDEKQDPNKPYNIRVQEMEAITGRKWNYQQLRESNDDLLGRVYEIQMEDRLRTLVLFTAVDYIKGEGSFNMNINPMAREYFFELKNNFTLMGLKSLLLCSSKYSKRIYSLCCRWKGTGGKEYTIREFKEMLGLIDPSGKKAEIYPQIGEFKKNVLEVAKKQINENTDITFDYSLIKKGRSFEKIIIFCGVAKPTFQLEIDFKEDPEYLKKVSAIVHFGITKETAEKIASRHWKEFVAAKNHIIAEMGKGKIIDDKGAYIVGILQNKGVLERKK